MPSFAAPWNLSRQRSFDRLRQEAQFAGADAVIGIEMTTKAFLGDPSNVEYAVFGTAVRDTTAGARPERSGPRIYTISGQDVYKLRRIGAETLGVIGHTCVVSVALSPMANQMMGSWWGNQEMTEVTQAVYAARGLAMNEVLRGRRARWGPTTWSSRRSRTRIHHHEYERTGSHSTSSSSPCTCSAPRSASARTSLTRPHWACRSCRSTLATTPSSGCPLARDHLRSSQMSTYDPTSTEGLAEHASERLQMNARGLFTSDLSVNEYLASSGRDSSRWAWWWARASTTSASSSPTGKPARRWASSPRRCTRPASWP